MLSNNSIRVLIIDDNEDDFFMTISMLSQLKDWALHIEWEEERDNAYHAMIQNDYDLFFLDYNLNTSGGLDLLEEAIQNGCERPVILLTEREDDFVERAAMTKGAADFIVKGEISRPLLQRSIRYAIERSRQMSQLRELTRIKERFFSQMSHELRTPLNAIIGYSGLLNEELEEQSAEQSKTDLKKIESAGRHLLALVDGILDLSKLESGKTEVTLEEVVLGEVLGEVESVVTPMMQQNENEFSVQIADEVELFSTDPLRLTQILSNLLSNAAKFTSKGNIILNVQKSREPNGEWLNFWVTDNGIGMTEDQQKKVFDSFAQADASITRKFGGTGLGLSISQHLSKLLGGSISVISSPGQGSTFRLKLPLTRQVETKKVKEYPKSIRKTMQQVSTYFLQSDLSEPSMGVILLPAPARSS